VRDCHRGIRIGHANLLELAALLPTAETRTLLLDLPGQGGEWVVLSAHVDGHDGGESEMDNASGLAWKSGACIA
jgi:hypothetical protein